ncbi:MAG: hypothetical protein ACI4TX_03505, partial [Christensenellales bacterium]
GTDITNDIDDDLDKEINDTLKFNINIDELFVDTAIDLMPYFTCVDINNFVIVIEADSNDVVIDGFEVVATSSGIVNFEIKYAKKDESEDLQYKKLANFAITFYDKLNDIDVSTESVSINEFNINMQFDAFIDFGCVTFDKTNLIIKSNDLSNQMCNLSVEIVDSMSGRLVFNYLKEINGEVNKFEKVINFEQDYEKYFQVYNKTTLSELGNQMDLHLTNGKLNYGDVCAYNEIEVINGLAISQVEYKFICETGGVCSVEELESGAKIIGQSIGATFISILYDDIVLFKFKVNVMQIDILNACSEKSAYEIYVNDEINISPQIVEPYYADYLIEYFCESENVAINDGIFSASCEGCYNVTIKVNNLSYNIEVNVKCKDINESNIIEMEVVDFISGNNIESIDATLNSSMFLIIHCTNLGGSEIDLTKDLYFTINDGDVSNVIQFSFIDVDTISIKFIKVGNYELKLHLQGVDYKDKSINLSID